MSKVVSMARASLPSGETLCTMDRFVSFTASPPSNFLQLYSKLYLMFCHSFEMVCSSRE